MGVIRYTVILEPEPEGSYSVHCPALPGCAAQGGTPDDALTAIRAAIVQSLSAWHEDQMAPPPDSVDCLGDEIYEVLAARADDGLPLTVETRDVEVDFDGMAQGTVDVERPPVLTVPALPGEGGLQRGILRAFIRHSGMTPEEFDIYVRSESRMVELRNVVEGATSGD